MVTTVRTSLRDNGFVRNVAKSIILTGDSLRPIVQKPIIDRFIGTQTNEHTLDAGCGRGLYTRTLLKYSKQVSALDYSDVCVAAMKRRLGHLPQLSLCQGSADALPFADQQFDLVTHCEVLEHINDDRKVLSELFRVMKPGGKLVLSVPVPPAPIDDKEHVREGYKLEDISQLMTEAGFKIVRHEYCMFNISKNIIRFQQWWTSKFSMPLPAMVLWPAYWERLFKPSEPKANNLPYDVVIEAYKPA